MNNLPRSTEQSTAPVRAALEAMLDKGVDCYWPRGSSHPFLEFRSHDDVPEIRDLLNRDWPVIERWLREQARPWTCAACGDTLLTPELTCGRCDWYARALSVVGLGGTGNRVHFIGMFGTSLCGRVVEYDPPGVDRHRDQACGRCLASIRALRNRLERVGSR